MTKVANYIAISAAIVTVLWLQMLILFNILYSISHGEDATAWAMLLGYAIMFGLPVTGIMAIVSSTLALIRRRLVRIIPAIVCLMGASVELCLCYLMFLSQ